MTHSYTSAVSPPEEAPAMTLLDEGILCPATVFESIRISSVLAALCT